MKALPLLAALIALPAALLADTVLLKDGTWIDALRIVPVPEERQTVITPVRGLARTVDTDDIVAVVPGPTVRGALQRRVDEQAKAIRRLETNLKIFEDLNDAAFHRLRQTLTETERTAAHRAERIAELRASLDEASQRGETLAQQAEALEETRQRQATEIENLTEARNSATAQLEHARQQLEETRQRTQQAARRAEELETELAERQGDLDLTRAQLDAAQGETERLTAAIEEREAKLAEHQSALDALNAKVAELRVERNRQAEQVASLAKQVASLEESLAETSSARDEAQQSADALQAERDALANRLAARDAELEEARAAHRDLKRQLDEARKEIESSKSASASGSPE